MSKNSSSSTQPLNRGFKGQLLPHGLLHLELLPSSFLPPGLLLGLQSPNTDYMVNMGVKKLVFINTTTYWFNQPNSRNNSESDYNSTEINDPAGAARAGFQQYEDTPPRPPRSAPAIPAPPRPPRDIPGRLLTRGDLIRYFTGYINTETQEEIWTTAVVIPMQMSLQRRYPNHYNVSNQDGSDCCLELLPGTKWEVRRNNTWQTY